MIAASVKDFRALARRRLPLLMFDYLDGGAYGELTLRKSVEDMEALALRQLVMRDVSALSMKTEWYGQPAAMPVALGPVGFAGMFARRGEVQAARAAQAAGVPFCLSTVSICSLEEVVAQTGQPVWQQLYMIKDRGFMAAFLERIAAQRAPALVMTVDLPVVGARYRDVHSGMSAPPGLRASLQRAWQGITHREWLFDVQLGGGPLIFGNLKDAVQDARGVGQFSQWVQKNFDASVTWKDLDFVRQHWKGPLVIKGLLDPADAREALANGADGIIVSNHGGRQLDGALSSVKAMPAIADAVGGQVPLFMDGGVRSGLDVLRCLALGAQGVFLGRAWAYALAADGERGVKRALDIICAELRVAMALTGCTDVRRAGSDLLA
ncbi:MAG: L-lactate dehydrogenase [Alphaproteobacteria bacterium]|nr:L-lactate dehydrogenase [Alphaproteobacteria bacterium]